MRKLWFVAIAGLVVAGFLLFGTPRRRDGTFERMARWSEPALTAAFRVGYHAGRKHTWMNTRWQGHEIQKYPTDMWVYQEILHETRPDVLIEAGTYKGGSALFFAQMFDLMGKGRVITIDVEDFPGKPRHPRIEYILGSSTDPKTVETVKGMLKPGERVMVSLDSLHTRDHVLGELRAWHGLVSPGNYMVVEDTNFNGHPIFRAFGPGPLEAVREFLAENRDFVSDSAREKFKLTANPQGFLRRVR